MNNNTVEIISLIYDGEYHRDLSTACSEIRHNGNRGDAHGRLGYCLNGYNLNDPELWSDFFGFLRTYPISRSISIDARFLNNDEILEILRNAPDLREVRIIGDGYVLTDAVMSRLPNNAVVVCDEVGDDVSAEHRNRVYAQHGLFRKETNYVEDDLVSAYFITHELSDQELDYLVDTVNRDNSADYCQISFRMYNPAMYKDLVTRLHDRGLRENVRLNFLGNPLYDRSEAYDGLGDIAGNPINVTYDTCSDMINLYTMEPYTVSNMHHSELEGGGQASLDSYSRLLNTLEEQEAHIQSQGYTPLEAAIYAYRFLQQNYAYDPNIHITDSIDALTNRQLDRVATNPTMVCEGYATLYSALMRRCGIPMFRYSTDRHVRNIGRIVDDKYGVDMIGVVDTTFDSSDILDDGTFAENRNLGHFMFSPREAINFDPYVTIATSLVLDYDRCGYHYLPFLSRDQYEDDLTPNYYPDGYAITMLDRMGIQLPEPLSFDSYRELVANLNRTTIFDEIDTSSLMRAYRYVLRTEEPELSDYDLDVREGIALSSIIDRVDDSMEIDPQVLINNREIQPTSFAIDPVLYPYDNSLSISNFNKPNSAGSATAQETTAEEGDNLGQGTAATSDAGHQEENESLSSANTVDSERTDDDENTVISSSGVRDSIDEAMNQVEVDSDDYIPGTMIRKPRFRGDYETDEEYVAYLAEYYGRYFPNAAAETHDRNTTYSLRREQIIQDLPIHSMQESRFEGLISNEEIEISRGKLR